MVDAQRPRSPGKERVAFRAGRRGSVIDLRSPHVASTDARAATADEVVGRRSDEGSEPEAPPTRRMSDVLRPAYLAHRLLVDVMVYLAAAVGAWSVRFVQDDAFISFRYARNLAEGRGLVFNPGERVEGYTNFLWTVLMALPEWLGWSTPFFSQVVGVALFLATLAVAWRLARRVLEDEALALIAVIVLTTNMTFLSYATGGLETMLQTLLVTAVAATLLPTARFDGTSLLPRHLAAGALAGLAILTRLDSAVLVVTFATVHVVLITRASPTDRWRRALSSVAAMSAPAVAIVLPWLLWKLAYYGQLAPNTATAKSGGSLLGQALFVALYFAAFFVGYFLFLLIGRWRRHRHVFFALPGARAVIWVVPVWFLYIAVAGADFMEFRFIVPIMPILALLVAVLIDNYRSPKLQVALVAALLFASVGHVTLPSLGYPVHTFRDLRIWPSDSPHALGSIGEHLAEAFPGGLDEPGQVVTSIGSLGALPYFSQLPTVDMVGLTDPFVAENGLPHKTFYPGHLRTAPLEYLIERQVNLVAGFPTTVDIDVDRESFRLSELVSVYPVVDLHELPPEATALEIPMDDRTSWVAIYLTPHALVERTIDESGWRRFPIERVCHEDDIHPLVQLVGSATC